MNYNIKYKIYSLFPVILIILFSFLFTGYGSKVKPSVIIEAGSPVPEITEFFISPKTTGKYITDTSSIDTKKIGETEIQLQIGRRIFTSVLTVRDAVPPSGKPAELYIFKGNEIVPESLVTDITDVTPVTCVFASTPDFNAAGWQNISIALTDAENNSTNIDTKFYVFDVIPELIFEAGNAVNISEMNFISNYDGITKQFMTLSETKKIDFLVPGEYPVTIKSGNYESSSVVKIVDTTPPTADIKNLSVLKNKSITADKFAYNITDISPVTIKFKAAPDFSTAGNKDIYLILEDKYNNISEYKAVLTVIADTTPPVISGTLNKRVVVGGTASYKSGVTVKDDYDPNVRITVDSSAVNLNKAGTYTVIYSSKDESGNKTEAKGTITVFNIDMDLVNQMADEILAKIITADMSGYNKAKAIYNWVIGKMKYSAASAALNLAQRAYDCFSKGRGDCYTYAAASQVLLTRAGIQNVMITRLPELEHPHYWNLINLGDGWYHFDTCPTPENAVSDSQRFLFTESQAEEYTETINTPYAYYAYDKSKFPSAVE